jgi:hypothetical protein
MMTMLPSVSNAPEMNFQVWVTMALVLDAIVLALGRLGRLGAAGCPSAPGAPSKVRKLVSTPRASKKAFTVPT